MITMKTINASNQEERDAFFTSLDQRTGETNQRVTETARSSAQSRLAVTRRSRITR